MKSTTCIECSCEYLRIHSSHFACNAVRRSLSNIDVLETVYSCEAIIIIVTSYVQVGAYEATLAVLGGEYGAHVPKNKLTHSSCRAHRSHQSEFNCATQTINVQNNRTTHHSSSSVSSSIWIAIKTERASCIGMRSNNIFIFITSSEFDAQNSNFRTT